MIRILWLVALFSVPLFPQATRAVFRCPGGEEIRVEFRNVTGPEKNHAVVDITGYPAIVLQEAISASGARYSDGFTTFWNKGDEASFYSGELTLRGCKQWDGTSPNVMSGEFVYFADAATFRACATGTQYPVAMEGAYIEAERAYSKAGLPAQSPMLIRIEGRIERRKSEEGSVALPTLVLTKFLGTESGKSCDEMATGVNGKWELTELDGKETTLVRKPTVEFDSATNRVAGFGGCNRFSGSYTQNGSELKFGMIAATKMACLGPMMETEDSLFKAFQQTTGFTATSDTLSLTTSDGTTIVRFRRQ